MAIIPLGIWKPTPRPRSIEPVQKRAGAVWAGASVGRLYNDWLAPDIDPVSEANAGLVLLRNRARDLERNSPYVRRYLELVEQNVVGYCGFNFQAKNMLGDVPNELVNESIEDAWKEFCRKGVCTRDGRRSFSGFMRQIVRRRKRDGEVFIWLRPEGPWGLQLVDLPPELVDDQYNVGPDANGIQIRQGVELDEWMRPIAYHVWKLGRIQWTSYAGSPRIRVPAENMLHWFDQRRAGQVRGESRLAPVLAWLRQHDAYIEAALVAARAGASKMAFVEKAEDSEVPEDTDLEDSDAAPQQPMEISPGLIEELDPGDKIHGYDPAYPNGEMAPFMKTISHLIAMGMGISHSSLTGDLSEVNYGSLRNGEVKERDLWRVEQAECIDEVIDPIFLRWWQFAQFKIKGIRAHPDEYLSHRWQPRGWDWIDPLKDAQAAKEMYALRITSLTRLAADRGIEIEEVLEEQAAEQAMADELGVTLWVPTADPKIGDINGVQEDPGNEGTSGGTGGAVPRSTGGGGARRVAGRRAAAHQSIALLRSPSGEVVGR